MNRSNLLKRLLITVAGFIVICSAGLGVSAQKDTKKEDPAKAEATRQEEEKKKQKQAQDRAAAEAKKQQQAQAEQARKAEQQRQAEAKRQRDAQAAQVRLQVQQRQTEAKRQRDAQAAQVRLQEQQRQAEVKRQQQIRQQQQKADANARQMQLKQQKQAEAARQQQMRQQSQADERVRKEQQRQADELRRQQALEQKRQNDAYRQTQNQKSAVTVRSTGMRTDAKVKVEYSQQRAKELKTKLQQQNQALYTRTPAQTKFEKRYVTQLPPRGSYLTYTRPQQQQIQQHRWNTYNNYWQIWSAAQSLRQRLVEQQRRNQFARYLDRYWNRLREDRYRLEQAQYYDNLVNDYYYYRDGEYYYTSQYGAEMLRNAVNNGYEEGYYAGQADRQDGWQYDPTQSYGYQDASFGYDNYYVSIDEYSYYFRQGFERGYDDGYDSRNQYGQFYDGRYYVLGELIAAIINAIRY